MEMQVQEVQQQLQNMELAMDSKESRVRKLEYEIKLMSGTLFSFFGLCMFNDLLFFHIVCILLKS